jgi:MYXO-CTERM domain-containing protein
MALNWTESPNILTISGFAFENSYNTAILAGAQGGGSAAVPEPGQVAASLLLLAGIAGYFAHRRRAAAGAEPSALHKLALGARGIEDFRSDKAA